MQKYSRTEEANLWFEFKANSLFYIRWQYISGKIIQRQHKITIFFIKFDAKTVVELQETTSFVNKIA